MVFLEPLNLQELFVNYFAGSMEIFYFITVILFTYLAARFRMPIQVFFILMGVFVIFMTAYYNAFLAIALFSIGIIIFIIWKKAQI